MVFIFTYLIQHVSILVTTIVLLIFMSFLFVMSKRFGSVLRIYFFSEDSVILTQKKTQSSII